VKVELPLGDVPGVVRDRVVTRRPARVTVRIVTDPRFEVARLLVPLGELRTGRPCSRTADAFLRDADLFMASA
jgi:hypothetical protein